MHSPIGSYHGYCTYVIRYADREKSPHARVKNYGKSIVHPVNINNHNIFNYAMISLTYLAVLS